MDTILPGIHPNRRFLYGVNEISNFEGQRTGSGSAFSKRLRDPHKEFPDE